MRDFNITGLQWSVHMSSPHSPFHIVIFFYFIFNDAVLQFYYIRTQYSANDMSIAERQHKDKQKHP